MAQFGVHFAIRRFRMSAPSATPYVCVVFALSYVTAAKPTVAQTGETVAANSYTIVEEAAIGRDAAAAIRSRLPLVADRQIDAYLSGRLARLVDALPPGLKHGGFDYRVATLKESELVSIAVPGGPIFISHGMIELAPDDAALTGLLAHELGHVALRHATTQATAGERYQLGEISGRTIGATAGGQAVGITDRAAHFSVSSYFLAFDAEHERQADRLAAEIMERAGYDAEASDAMFQVAITNGVPRAGGWWAMRHPSKHRETDADEAAVRRTPEPSHELGSIQARLRGFPDERPAASEHHGRRSAPIGTVGYGVMPPSGEARSVSAGDGLLLNVPANWDRIPTGNTAIFAPAGAYVRADEGATAVTHGLQIGIARSLTGTLHGDIHMLLAAFGRNNRSLAWTAAFRQVRIGGRAALTTTISHVSPMTGEFETISVYAVDLPDGSLLYAVGLAPQYDASVYGNAFTRVLNSIQIEN